ncbi:DUF3530 family protein [Pseudoalteromonas sp. T1lg65]|uniref:DUF3530 family protein n=1 Tax=Pseudoalteromonas sp. T1lg65 TaxID=2077101 RepID=UPI003F7A76E3
MPSYAAEHINAIEKQRLFDQDAEQYLDVAQLVKLQQGESEFYTYFQPYMAPQRNGIVIIIPDMLAPPINGNGPSYLFKQLSDDGFDTYALTPPELSFAPNILGDQQISTQGVVSQPQNTLSEANLDNYKQALVERFQALYQTLTMAPAEQLVVVAFGNSAGLFTEYLATLPNLRVNAFVIVSTQIANSERQKQLASKLSVISPALLDLYYTFDSPLVLNNLQDRRRWAQRNSKFDYRQRELYGERHDPNQHKRLRKELIGFLRVL